MTENTFSSIVLSRRLSDRLVCPRCHAGLVPEGGGLRCTESTCAAAYPIVQGVPVLINETNSLFSLNDFKAGAPAVQRERGFTAKAARFLPSISKNYHSKSNYRMLCEKLQVLSPLPLVLVVGGKIEGAGMEVFADFPTVELVSGDVAFGPSTEMIFDAHDIPFQDGTFDGVVIQAVLEHVCDPYRCVDEIHRVLKHDGFVYAETPFMQQVHEGAYDFTRFSHLGHRRLFRRFTEVESGIVGGPGMAYAWSYRYFLLSFFRTRMLRLLASLWARITAFFWKYLDAYLIHRPGAYDSASGFYFLGRRSDQVLPDRELVKLYRGMVHPAERG